MGNSPLLFLHTNTNRNYVSDKMLLKGKLIPFHRIWQLQLHINSAKGVEKGHPSCSD